LSTTVRLRLPAPHPGQERIKREARRFNCVACGRRFGKTLLGEDLAVGVALAGRPVAWFSPTYKMLAEVWRDLKEALQPVTRRVSEQEHRLELITGGTVDCWSLDSADTVRGRAYARVVVDEAAMVPDLLEVWRNVIRPTLADLIGDAWFLSTPKGLNGFWHLYRAGEDPEQPDWASWRLPTLDNPYIRPAEVEAARASLPERSFAQEWEAAFLAEGTGVFRGVAEACTARPQHERAAGHAYVFGVDWGQVDDFTVVSVLDVRPDKVEQVALDRFNRIEFYTQAGRLRILYERFRPQVIVAEANAQAMMLEQLRQWDLPVWGWTATNATKAAAVEALSLALERRQIALLPDEVQTSELLAYGAEKLPSGMVRYGAPEGTHDDCVSALMLAWLGACGADGAALKQSTFRVTQ
jgi:hypothetical protein